MNNSCPQCAYLYIAFTKQIRLYGHPAKHVNVITLKWEIIWTGGLPHLSGLPHLPGVPHLHVNRPLGSTRSHRDLAKSPRVLGEISFISPKCLSSRRDLVAISEKLQISPSSWRDLVYLAEISFISARSRLSRWNIFHLARVSARSRQYLARDRFHLVPISEISQISPSSWRILAATLETLQISPRYWRDLCDNTNLAEISSISARSRLNFCTGQQLCIKTFHGVL